MAIDAEGTTYVTGGSGDDVWLAAFDQDGAELWSTSVGGAAMGFPEQTEDGTSVAVSDSGDLLVLVETTGMALEGEVIAFRYDPHSEAFGWAVQIPPEPVNPLFMTDGAPFGPASIAETADGDVAFTAEIQGSFFSDAFVMVLSGQTGEEIWRRHLDDTVLDAGPIVAVPGGDRCPGCRTSRSHRPRCRR